MVGTMGIINLEALVQYGVSWRGPHTWYGFLKLFLLLLDFGEKALYITACDSTNNVDKTQDNYSRFRVASSTRAAKPTVEALPATVLTRPVPRAFHLAPATGLAPI